MQHRAFVWGVATFLSLAAACAGSSQVAEIQVGVKANSIWFEDAAQLAQWQASWTPAR